MKKITIITMALLSVNFLFAFEKNEKSNFLLTKTNDLVLNTNNLINPEFKLTKKRGRGGDDAFGEGKIVISAGYGIGNFTKTLFKVISTNTLYTAYSFKGFGPIHFKAEYGLSDKMGLGLSVNYVSASATWTNYYNGPWNAATGTYDQIAYTETMGFSSLSFLLRMNLHFATTAKLDPYWGIGAGYRTGGWKYSSTYPNSTPVGTLGGAMPFGFETTFGMRYYFTDNIGLYMEIGYAKSILQ